MPETLSALAVLTELRGSVDDAVELRETARTVTRMSETSRSALVRAARNGRLLPSEAEPPKGFFKFRLRNPDGYDRYLKLSGQTAHWIQQVCQRGSDAVLGDLQARVPSDIATLLSADVLGPEEVLALHRGFGAVTAADFGALLSLPVDGPAAAVVRRLAPRLRQVLPTLRQGRPRIPLGRAASLFDAVTEYLQDVDPAASIEPGGSLRRFDATIGDLLLMVISEMPTLLLQHLCDNPEVDVRYRGTESATLQLRKEEVHVRVVRPDEAPCMVLHYTGSPGHVEQLRERAAARGWQLSASGLRRADTGEAIRVESEQDIYRWLDLPYIPPELRHGEREVDAALSGAFDDLVTVDDIRGDLHMHTLWSDGRDTVDTMVRAAEKLGYEYVAITDHSPSAGASRVLTLDRLERQMEEVRAVRRQHPNIAVLQGAEVDILPDGSLDLPDRVLAELDVVLASLHDRAGHTVAQLMARYAAAMRHPLVHIITHPTNRLIGRQEGYELEFEELFQLAVDTGTFLEVDGAPAHLDLDGRAAHAAAMAGVMLAVDSDCHNSLHLGRQMFFGVATARRGAVSRRQVLNTKPLTEVRAWLARKRAAAQTRVLP
ncbi:MAG: PHP domain-containing protein [Vicinamibacterales bacterium]